MFTVTIQSCLFEGIPDNRKYPIYLSVGRKNIFPANRVSHKIRAFIKKCSHNFTLFRRVQVFGPLRSLLSFRLTEFPQDRKGYKWNFATWKTINNHARMYTAAGNSIIYSSCILKTNFLCILRYFPLWTDGNSSICKIKSPNVCWSIQIYRHSPGQSSELIFQTFGNPKHNSNHLGPYNDLFFKISIIYNLQGS